MFDPDSDYMVFDTMLKAVPVEDGGDRIIYVQASNENKDYQGEIVLAKALQESADYFTRFGVVDMDHKSIPKIAKRFGITNTDEWIIGQPIECRFNGDSTFVKAQLRSGDSPLAAQANIVWEGLTKVNPPVRYFASVGGAVLDRDIKIDPQSGEPVPVITRTLWGSLALSKAPVNLTLDAATTVPVMTFAKSMGGFIPVVKALTAGYGTDATTLTGGAALGQQSLDGVPVNYFDFRERLSRDVRQKRISPLTISSLVDYATSKYRLSRDDAAQWVGKFLRELNKRRAKL